MESQEPHNCIIHCRVSTAKQAREGESLEEQELIGRRVAERNGWRVLKVFHEPYSGRKNSRPVFDDILSFIRKSPNPVNAYIFKGIDRLTRAGVVEYESMKSKLAELGALAIDSYGLIQPKQNTLSHLGFEYDWSIYSPSEAAELLEAHRGKQEVRDILTRMIGAQIKLVQDGYKVARPADGYVIKRIEVEGKKRCIEVPDPKRAPFFREMFRLRALGCSSDKDIVERLNAQGYRSKPHRKWNRDKSKTLGWSEAKPLTVKRFQSIIAKPIYCGVRCEKWTNHRPIHTRYPGLVSIETFNRANRGKLQVSRRGDRLAILREGHASTQRVRRLRNNPLYPYKNIVLCPLCGSKPFLGSATRGKMGTYYPAYHCNRGHYLRIAKSDFEETVDTYLRSIAVNGEFLERFKSALLRAYDRRGVESAKHQERVEANVEELRAQQESAVSALIAATDPTVRQKIEPRIAGLERQIATARTDEPMELERCDLDYFVDSVAETMELDRFLKQSVSVSRQTALAGLVFERLPTYDEITNGTPLLTFVFGLVRAFRYGESVNVHLRGFEWNSIVEAIRRWNRLGPRNSDNPGAEA